MELMLAHSTRDLWTACSGAAQSEGLRVCGGFRLDTDPMSQTAASMRDVTWVCRATQHRYVMRLTVTYL